MFTAVHKTFRSVLINIVQMITMFHNINNLTVSNVVTAAYNRDNG
jgi:hypothetical protein